MRIAISTVVFVLALCAGGHVHASSSGVDRVALSGHVLPDLARAARSSTEASSPEAKAARSAEPVVLTVVLRRSDPVGFERFLASLYQPGSPEFRRFPTPLEVSRRFGPTVAEYDLVRAYFTGQGLVPLEDSANRLTLRVMGTRAQVETALALQLHDFTLEGKRFRANDREPVLPRAIADHVEAIVGLSDLAQPAHLNTTFESLDRCLRNAEGVYTPDLQLACAVIYGIDAALYDLVCAFVLVAIQLDLSLTGIGAAAAGQVVNRITGCHFVYPGGPVGKWANRAATPDASATAERRSPRGAGPQFPPGTGQKIGLVEFDSYLQSDVEGFLALVGFDPDQIDKISEVKLNGGAPLGADQDEVLVDIAQATVLAPGAEIVVYDIPFALGSYQALFNRMLLDGMTVVSNSWTYCEDQTTLADVTSIDSVLASLAASGVTVLNASGDTGSTCLGRSANTIGVPSGSPNATAVGGSSLVTGPAPLYASETWWNGTNSNPPTGQGGFGVSRYFARPAYQNGFTSSAFRSVPDVVAAADPVTNGKPICQAAKGGCPSGLFYGGTSVAAPLWAAIVADLNSAMGENIGFLNPQLYPLSGTGALHGPAELQSDFAHVGLGSPNAARLYLALSGQALGAVSASISGVTALPAEVAADGITQGTVVVQLRDTNGLPVPGKTVSLSANAGSEVVITPASAVTSIANGAVQFAVRDATVETVTFTALDTTDGLSIGTTSIAFVPPPATAGSIVAFPTTVAANGVATTTITITLQDAQGLPASGKAVTLQQGAAHAIVTGPSPAVTDAAGQIQFVARNKFAENVTFTAVDETDGKLPVPGAAQVAFTNSTQASCAALPTAGTGYTVSAFATGFVAEPFTFGNVNWMGCPGASNPTFDTLGNVYITDFRTGELFRFGLDGGVAASPLANAGITVGQPTLGLDGRLYAARGAAGSGATTGNIVEIDPASGATLRVVAANLTCPNGLSVDPLSGDLFFDNQCFGGVLANPAIFRLTDPADTDANRPTEVVVYASLPAPPSGWMAFSPDGSLYVVGAYTSPPATVYRVAGTDQPQPAAVTPVAGVASNYWINVGEVDENGAAISLIVLGSVDPFPLQVVDLTEAPPTFTTIATGLGSGTVGPDGCLYSTAGDAVYRIAPSSGACRFSATNPTPALALSPASVQPDPVQGTTLTLQAQLHNTTPLPGQTIAFQVTGANLALQVVPFDAEGHAEFTYLGEAAGTDSVQARTVRGDVEMLSNPARVVWTAGDHPTALDLGFSAGGGISGRSTMLRARLVDRSVDPAAPVVGATVNFALAGPACIAITNAAGIASYAALLPAAGSYTLAASFAGSAGLLPSSASRSFFITPASAADDLFSDGFE